MKCVELLKKMEKAKNEKEVESSWNRFLDISEKIEYIKNSDGVYGNKLFEYKFDIRFCDGKKWSKGAYKALAQSIYYLKKISSMDMENQTCLPSVNIVISKMGGFTVPTQILERIVGDGEVGLTVDWLRAPSSPDPVLTSWLEENKFFEHYSIKYYPFLSEDHIGEFKKNINATNPQPARIEINEDNFVKIFELWKKLFWDSESDPRQVADNYVLDINLKFDFLGEQSVLVNMETGREWSVDKNKYLMFWSFYKRPPSVKVQQHILSHKDCLYDDILRNDTGDFYTPLDVANLARKYIAQILSPQELSEFLWWDPAAGGANLFIQSPNKSQIILSTLEKTDFRTLKSFPQFRESTIGNFNFLKDKRPSEIDKKIQENNKIFFLLNPPFNDQTGHSQGKTKDPNSVGEEFIKMEHTTELTLRSIRGAYSKFMYRIDNVFEESHLDGYVGIFSKSGWLSGVDSKDFLEFWHRRYEYKAGFIVPSKVFKGTKGDWPVLFSLWKKREVVDYEITPHDIFVDIFDDKLEKIGVKQYVPYLSNQVRLQDTLNKDCLKNKSKQTKPPLKNEYQIYEGKPYCDFLYEGGLGYLYCFANDVQHSGSKLMLLSLPYGGSNANGLTITKENFESCLRVYGIRKSVKLNWINDKDEFYISDSGFSSNDFRKISRMSILWSILEGGYTSSLRNIKYEGKKYDVNNEFFALSQKELSSLNVDMELLPEKDSFASCWIKRNYEQFSQPELKAIEAYRMFIVESINSGGRNQGDQKRQIKNLDASPRQIINGVLNFLKTVPNDLTKKYENYIDALGVLQQKINALVLKLNIVPNNKIFSENEPVTEENVLKLPKKNSSLLTKEEMNRLANERLEVAAYIIHRLKEDKFLGRTKLAKVFYLVDLNCNSNLKTNYKREAAGPLDPSVVYSESFGYEQLGVKNKLFRIVEDKNSVKYLPEKELTKFVKSTNGNWKNDIKIIDKVIEILKPLNARQAEIVATLYACWNDLIIDKMEVTDKKIIDEFFNNWHEKKKRFNRDAIKKALKWMKEKDLVPEGKKNHTRGFQNKNVA